MRQLRVARKDGHEARLIFEPSGIYSRSPLLYSDDGKGTRSVEPSEPSYYLKRILSSPPAG